ncbi:MAG TPA: MBL fold metallo-hydrolase [Bryobacteraceae bacterium]|nr:MBL fold metallo-hydrolase [Bryobacteraceae bacterium]
MRFLATLFALAGAVHAAKTLEIYFIDVEGGQSTLVVAPSGQSLLIDAGYSNFSGRDADRIAAAAKLAHVKHIDNVLITHHHPDHEGGVPNLLERFTVGNFYDKGPSVDPSPDKTNKAYEDAMSKQQRQRIKPGDTIAVKGIDVTVMVAAGEHVERKGEPNPYCAGIATHPDESGENTQSAGVLIQYGKFRFADLGDLTWNKEIALLCPENRVGKVDLFLTDHHGGETSPAIHGMAPRVTIMNNGARKGGDPKGWKTVNTSPGLEDMWQLHFAVAGGKETNVSDTMIANLEEHCEGKFLKVSAEASGAFTVYNSRNKFSKTYAAR